MAFANAQKQNRSRNKRGVTTKLADQQKGTGYVTDAVLGDALEPLLEALFLEGRAHVAAASPGTVARFTCRLERLLVVYGIVPQSKRAEDPQAYARNLQSVADSAFREEFRARCDKLRRTRLLPIAGIPDDEASSVVEAVSAQSP